MTWAGGESSFELIKSTQPPRRALKLCVFAVFTVCLLCVYCVFTVCLLCVYCMRAAQKRAQVSRGDQNARSPRPPPRLPVEGRGPRPPPRLPAGVPQGSLPRVVLQREVLPRRPLRGGAARWGPGGAQTMPGPSQPNATSTATQATLVLGKAWFHLHTSAQQRRVAFEARRERRQSRPFPDKRRKTFRK